MRTEHLASLGAVEVPRRDFVRAVKELVKKPPVPSPWQPDDDLKTAVR
jgi:Leu/Phe-tRNA-protein transferase